MMKNSLLEFDREHLWHPYTSLLNPLPVYRVQKANGTKIILENGQELIDGMASWWCVIHGYNHPVLNEALTQQAQRMSHVMFGGLTHEPAILLAQKLIEITCPNLTKVFFCDSGSVSVEVALKMSLQYWKAQNIHIKNRFLTIRSGYHGDTFGAMSICDPVNGMHHLFKGVLLENFFAPTPECKFNQPWDEKYIKDFYKIVEQQHHQIAAVVLEPIVQGAGGMKFYSPDFLKKVRELCDEFNILLILDEIATGFGRSGKLFAYEHADIQPDIMCVGKALTGGYMTLAATLASDKVCEGVASDNKGVLMHGPTFMANPLACSVAYASVNLLLSSNWERKIKKIESQLKEELMNCVDLQYVKDVRVLGAIGVVELDSEVNISKIQSFFVQNNVWIRPFNNLIYIMPPYIISSNEISQLTRAIYDAILSKEFV